MTGELPIFALRGAFMDALGRAPIVLSSPTGSGKSTEVPRWCEGRVLVIEPRRIACRSLAARVAELEGARLGDAVGYVVRDERVAGCATRVVFATPGVVLRSPEMLLDAGTVVLDEFHERSLDVDLLLALLVRRGKKGLVVMSATLEGERVARHVSGKVERVFAKRVVAMREEVPTGEVARAAIAELLRRGSLFREAMAAARVRLARARLAAELAARGHAAGVASPSPVLDLDAWVVARLAALGVESGDDLALLSAKDFVPDDVPFEARERLDREFPLTVHAGDAAYEADYDIARGQVTLRMTHGSRQTPPPLAYLPRFVGLRICVDGPRGVTVLRERG